MMRNLRNLGNMGVVGQAMFAAARETLQDLNEREVIEDLDNLIERFSAFIENADQAISEVRELVAIFKIAGLNISLGDIPEELLEEEEDGDEPTTEGDNE